MKDPCRRFHRGADTSTLAWESVRPQVLSLRKAVLDSIRELRTATCEDVEQHLNISHQSASARITELRRDGLVRDTGLRGPTSTGRKARIYEVMPAIGQLLLFQGGRP